MKYSKSKITPEIMCDIFSIKTVPYNRRNDTTLHCRDADIILYGSEVISSLGPKIWVLLTPKMRNIKFTEEFNKKIREWTQSVVCISCLYRLCKIYKTLVFIHESQYCRGRGRAFLLSLQYHFHPLHRHLDISQVITAES